MSLDHDLTRELASQTRVQSSELKSRDARKELHGVRARAALRAVIPLGLAVIGLAMLWIGWRKWPGILTDAGRELYLPWQLNEGKVLYRDLAHLFGPLSQYVNSWVYANFGRGMMSLVAVNVAITGGIAFMIYRFFRETSGAIAATATSATFLAVFAASQYGRYGNFSYVFPYSHELVHGTFLSLATLMLFLKYLKSGQIRWLAAMGFCFGLISLTKAEVFMAMAVSLLAGLTLQARLEKPELKTLAVSVTCFVAAALVPIVVFLVYFASHIPVGEAVGVLLFPYTVVADPAFSDNAYYRWVSGSDAPAANSLRLGGWAVGYGVVALAFCALASGCRRWGGRPWLQKRWVRRGLTLGLVTITISVMSSSVLLDVVYPLPVFVLVLVTVLAVQLRRSSGDAARQPRLLALFAFSVFAFVLLGKILLKVTVWHYGFVLAMPASLLLVATLTTWMPDYLGKRIGGLAVLRTVGVLVVIAGIGSHMLASRAVYAERDYRIGEGVDAVLAWRPAISVKGPRMRAALAAIEATVGRDETFVVFPEGVMLNYFTRRANPSAYIDYTPHLIAGLGEDAMLDSLREGDPDYVLVLESDTTPFGARYFGVDYATDIMRWVSENYTPVVTLHAGSRSGEPFGLLMAKSGSEE